MTDDSKKELSSVEDSVEMAFQTTGDDREKIEDIVSKVNIDSLKNNVKNSFHDLDQAEEYQSKLAKLDKLQKLSYMNQSKTFDRLEFSSKSIILTALIIYVCWFYFPEIAYKEYLMNPARLKGIGPIGVEVLIKLVMLFKIASPVLIYYIYQKFPLNQKTKYELTLDYLYICGPREITYKSVLERVKVKWIDIVDIKYDNKHKINHIRCLDKNGKDLLAIRLDVKNFDKLSKLVVEYTEIEHPLNKIFN